MWNGCFNLGKTGGKLQIRNIYIFARNAKAISDSRR